MCVGQRVVPKSPWCVFVYHGEEERGKGLRGVAIVNGDGERGM